VALTVTELFNCKNAEDVTNIAAPNKNGLVRFKGSSIFIPDPVLHNAILNSDTNNPFKLIPIVSKTAKTFDFEHKNNKTMTSNTITHADDHSSWGFMVL
jgi:hypothetical protein